MKNIMIIGAATLLFAGAATAVLSIYPVKESHALTYTVKKYTIKPAYMGVNCTTTGYPVGDVVHMDPSESGPCDCPQYYNYNGLVQYSFMGYRCYIPDL